MPGISIGNWAIIGAYSAVTKNVEQPYTIVADNPVHSVRKGFTDDIIEKLLQIIMVGLRI